MRKILLNLSEGASYASHFKLMDAAKHWQLLQSPLPDDSIIRFV